jgi:hypothetical protein
MLKEAEWRCIWIWWGKIYCYKVLHRKEDHVSTTPNYSHKPENGIAVPELAAYLYRTGPP